MNRGFVYRIAGRPFLQILGAQAAVSLATVLLLLSLGPGWNLNFGLILANTIGWLAWFVLPSIGLYAVRLQPVSRWGLLTIAMLGVSLAGELLGLLILAGAGGVEWSDFWSSYVHNIPITAALSLVMGIGITAYETMRHQKEYETAQARLASLESRLQPHFLFNTLNSILALIPEDPAAAESMTEKLAGLLRFSLDSSGRQTVPLHRELKVATDYLEIERTRFGPRLRYSVDVPESLMNIHVPPFSIQTLVENSVKNGGVEIRISAKDDAGRLVLEVWDSGEDSAIPQILPAGHGLQNLRSRLAVLFGGGASLEFPRERAGTTARVSLPTVRPDERPTTFDCLPR